MDASSIFDQNTITLPNLKEPKARIVKVEEFTFQTHDYETIVTVPQRLGEGWNRLIRLRGGLTIEIIHGQLRETMHLKRQHEQIFPITAHFYLSGGSRVETQNIKEIEPSYLELAGMNYLYHLPDLTEMEQWPSDTMIKLVGIYAPIEYFTNFSATDQTSSNPLQSLIKGDRNLRFHLSLGKNTPEMVKVLQQIYQCPYQGLMKQLYLESKALELFALQFSSFDSSLFVKEKSNFKKDDLDRVEYARDILINSFLNPPSLVELAHQVGLNDRKLKQGFRQLFDTTVFGYLYNHRMAQAQQLLQNSNLSIAQVAVRVGYSNSEAFSTAFRRKFALSPKAYQSTMNN